MKPIATEISERNAEGAANFKKQTLPLARSDYILRAMPQQYSCLSLACKEELRHRLRMQRLSLAPEERQDFSLAASGHIASSAFWRNAEIVALYIAVRGETDTAALLADAWKNGKTVLLPSCAGQEAGNMHFVSCSGMASLRAGVFDIPEPLPAEKEEESDSSGENACDDVKSMPEPEIIILPGLAFDRAGTRLGTGGGYYDRLLALPPYKNSLRMGFAYSFQIMDNLPKEAWDVPVHAVCSEQGITWIAGP
ncbi:MAG: 5-formyltetrahydrofolate cyclo-ligase [Desulfovibrio sp.]|jgi:5-formyltetrahydrofolate cyclo-ligase|nr:5-formyltetrahydrofolate cyclo-ligase [Desulfovibrio sp.]